MSGANYTSFFIEVAFEEVYNQHGSFRLNFHKFYTEISSKTPESLKKSYWKLLFLSKISSKATLVKNWIGCSFYS